MAKEKQLNQEGDVISHESLGKGEWLVVKTAFTGGGTGHGPHDVYPDGHQLTLRKLRHKSDVIAITFEPQERFQSGCFRNMLPYITPIKRMRKIETWIPVKS